MRKENNIKNLKNIFDKYELPGKGCSLRIFIGDTLINYEFSTTRKMRVAEILSLLHEKKSFKDFYGDKKMVLVYNGTVLQNSMFLNRVGVYFRLKEKKPKID